MMTNALRQQSIPAYAAEEYVGSTTYNIGQFNR